MNKNYFQNVAKNLESASCKPFGKITFPVLKAYEYWARVLKTNPDYQRPSEIIKILPMASARKVIKSVHDSLFSENLEELSNAVVEKNRSPKKKPLIKPNDDDIDDLPFSSFDLDDEEDFGPRRKKKGPNLSHSFDCRKRAIRDLDSAAKSGYMPQVEEAFRQHLDNETIFDQKVQKSLFKAFIDEVHVLLKKGVPASDPYLNRLQVIQDAYHLTDTEMEYLIFNWVFFNERKCDDLCDYMNARRRRDANNAELFQKITGASTAVVENITSEMGTLRRMLVINEELNPLTKLILFLDGKAGKDYAANYFKVYSGKAIPFEQLQGDNPKAKVMLELLSHHKKGTPMNILLYGVEGTGKTELAKAIASKLGRKLIVTNESETGNKNDHDSSRINDNMAGILLSADHFRNEDVIILADEADLILNNCEKGALNLYLEQVKVPVIWISNNLHGIERSTLRRFNYSMEFERLDAEKRNSVWQSVIKAEEAEELLSPAVVKKLSAQIPVTAGGITQAIRAAKSLKKSKSKITAEEIVKQMATAQANLLNIELEYGDRDIMSHAPRYSIDILNTDADMPRIHKILSGFNRAWEAMKEEDTPDSLNILLYGAPGTGKTEFARHIARKLKRPIVIKRASDILDKYVGESEKIIRQMFREAEERKAVLFLDEADSLLRSRKGARNSWEISQTNEILTQMENFKGIFIAATNFNEELDEASNRRFALKVKFDYLKPAAIEAVWPMYFPEQEIPAEAKSLSMLTPGDFSAVYKQLRFYPKEEVTSEKVLEELRKEVRFKDDRCGRRMGL